MEQYPPVLTKADFTRRYLAGEFGNRSPTWLTLTDYLKEGLEDSEERYHLRNRVAGGDTYYRVHPRTIPSLWLEQAHPENWYCSQMVPASVERTLQIQGEVVVTEKGLRLYYSQVLKPMREALAEKAEEKTGIIAVATLKAHLCPNSYEWLEELLKRYPGHVVEFSCYGKKWGTLPNFNSVFWEVRNF